MSSNPYASPSYDPKQFPDGPGYAPPPNNGSYGMVSQVRIVAILNGVQGLLEIPMGLMNLGMALMFPLMMRMDPNIQKQPNPPPEWLFNWVFPAVYIAMGAVFLLAGILRIVAAYQNFYYRSRTLGLVSLGVGMLSLLTCYCAPTAIAVLIYGLIIYLHPAVAAAFQMGREGRSGDEILAAFTPYRKM